MSKIPGVERPWTTRELMIDPPIRKRRIKPRWSCLRHHEHRWYWTAWLCIALRRGEKP